MRIRSIVFVPALIAGTLVAGGVAAQSAPSGPAATPSAQAAEGVAAAAPAAEGTPAAAAAPAASATPGKPAWMPEVKPDKGLVIIFRESHFVGSAVAMKVLADEGTVLPKLKNGRVVHYYLDPGDHTLYSDKKKQRDARIVGIEAGQVYFFEGRWETNMWRKADVDLVPVPYEEGVRRVSEFKNPNPG